MSEAPDLVETLAHIRDLCYQEAEIIDRYVQAQVKTALRMWDASKIKWTVATGQKGAFERSDDFDSVDHKALVKDLAEHNGKLSREGFFYWLFQNGSAIGRKKKPDNP